MTKEELPKGKLSNIILRVLLESDKYGYEIIEEIKSKTNDSLVVKQPSLYSALKRMEDQNLISSYWRDSDIGGRRHYYSITDYGKKYAEKWNFDFSIKSSENTSKKSSDNTSNVEEKQQEEQKPTILKQGNLFDNPKTQKTAIEQEVKEEQIPKTYVQFDLFTKPQVCEPSDEIFDCIKKLRDSADETQDLSENENNSIEALRHKNNEEILTSYESNTYKIDNKTSKNEFFNNFEHKQKSFASQLKSKPMQFDDDYTEDYEIDQNTTITTTQTNELIESDDNNVPIKEQDTTTNFVSFSPIESNDAVNDETNKNNNAVQFIDLDDISNNTLDVSNNDDIETDLQEELTKKNEINDITSDINQIEINETVEQQIEHGDEIHTKDGAVVITKHIENIPRVKKITPTRFEHIKINTQDNIIDKKIFEKQNANFENIQVETPSQNVSNSQSSIVKSDFESLKEYYQSIGIKFGVYEKPRQVKVNKTDNKFTTLISSITLFSLVLLETILMFAFNIKAQPSWNWLYIVCPLLILGLLCYNVIMAYLNKNNPIKNFMQKLFASWTTLVITVIFCIVILFSINLICGVELDNISNLVTTFIYLSLLIINSIPYKVVTDIIN